MTVNQFSLPITANQTFTGQTIQIDGIRFENCKFINCHLIYSGGPADASACEFSPNLTWEFRGSVGILMATLPRFGWRLEFGNPGPQAPAIAIRPV